MKTHKVLSEISVGINTRFFLALQSLMDSSKIASLEAFCKENGLSRPKYSEFRKEYISSSADITPQSRYKILDNEAVFALVTKYGISANWLITGEGSMVNQNS